MIREGAADIFKHSISPIVSVVFFNGFMFSLCFANPSMLQLEWAG
jgi:hypothetical protein